MSVGPSGQVSVPFLDHRGWLSVGSFLGSSHRNRLSVHYSIEPSPRKSGSVRMCIDVGNNCKIDVEVLFKTRSWWVDSVRIQGLGFSITNNKIRRLKTPLNNMTLSIK